MERRAETGDLKCAFIARASTDRQGDTVENQIAILNEYIKRQNIGTVKKEHIFEDVNISAYKTDVFSRDSIIKIVELSRKGDINCLVMKSASRFARDFVDSVNSIERLESYGLRVLSFEEGYDSWREDTRQFFYFYAMQAETESSKKSISVKLGIEQAVKKGHYNGEAPYGYRKQDKRLVIEESEARIVKVIYHFYANSPKGVQAVVECLHRKGYRTRKGNSFNRSHVRDILMNEAYTGSSVYGKTSSEIKKVFDEGNGRHKVVVRNRNKPEDWLVVKDSHEPIIDANLFELVQLKRMKQITPKRPSRDSKIMSNSHHPLTGVLFCPKCGKRMTGVTRTNRRNESLKYRTYVCSTRRKEGLFMCNMQSLSAGTLETTIYNALNESVKGQISKQKIIENTVIIDSDKGRLESELKTIDAKIKKAEKDSADLFLHRDTLSSEVYRTLQIQFSDELKSLKASKEIAKSELLSKQDEASLIGEINEQIDAFFRGEPSDELYLRKMFQYFITEVIPDEGTLRISYRFG